MKNKTIELPEGVLKIKKGFNPNSSSIGTVIYSFPIAFVVVSSIIAILTFFVGGEKKDGNDED